MRQFFAKGSPSGGAVRAYAEEMNQLNHDRRAQAETDKKALQKIERAIAGILAVIEEGMYQPAMKARMDELERQKTEITERLAKAPADIPDLHSNVANIYRQNVTRFTEALSDRWAYVSPISNLLILRVQLGRIAITGSKVREARATLTPCRATATSAISRR